MEEISVNYNKSPVTLIGNKRWAISWTQSGDGAGGFLHQSIRVASHWLRPAVPSHELVNKSFVPGTPFCILESNKTTLSLRRTAAQSEALIQGSAWCTCQSGEAPATSRQQGVSGERLLQQSLHHYAQPPQAFLLQDVVRETQFVLGDRRRTERRRRRSRRRSREETQRI